MRFLPAALAALVLFAAGCGGDDEPASSAVKTGKGTFPATVEHRFGTTTVEQEPERIVVVGLTEQDIVLALGKTPIATTEWYGNQPNAVWPWARDELGDAKPVVLKAPDGFQFEKIARLRPDLIIGTNSGMKKGDYEKLSKLAPTVAGVKGGTDYFGAWDEQTELVAAALGRAEEGRQLVADVKDAYAKVASDHPEWKGKTATFSQNGFYDGQLYVYPEDVNTEFLTYLGFEINPEINALSKNRGEQVPISAEQLDLLEADTIVFATEKPKDIPALFDVGTFPQIPAVAENRSVYTDATLSGAMYFMTPLSMLYVLERLTPQLELALDGKAPRELVGGTAPVDTEEAAFPAKVEHRYGTTTVEEEPERVVVAGLREQDALLSLGVRPVAVTEWLGVYDGEIGPWAKDDLGGEPLPEVLPSADGIDVEKIAAQRPDLIVAIYSGMKKGEYEKLSRLAPVIAQPEDVVDYGSSWEQELAMTAAAVGRPTAGEQVAERTHAEFEAVREDHPEFSGKQAVVATPYEGFYVYGPQDARSRLLEDLGFTFPSSLAKVGEGGDGFGGALSEERTDLLDLDAVVWLANPGPAKKIRSHPVYSKLPVRTQERDVYLSDTDPLTNATSFVSPLSIPLIVDELVPKLSRAVG